MFNHVLQAESMEFDIDIGTDLWMTKARFPRLQRDYLDPFQVSNFLSRCRMINKSHGKRGMIAQMFCASARTADGVERHTWGNCMMAFTYQNSSKRDMPPTLVMHSRVSYIAWVGAIDLALAWVIAREIARDGGFEVEDIKFRWCLDALAWHGFKSLSYVDTFERESKWATKARREGADYPVLAMTRKMMGQLEGWRQEEKPLEDIKYNQLQRMFQRYLIVKEGPGFPSIPLDSLELLPKMFIELPEHKAGSYQAHPRRPKGE
jgi:hypothetical protein